MIYFYNFFFYFHVNINRFNSHTCSHKFKVYYFYKIIEKLLRKHFCIRIKFKNELLWLKKIKRQRSKWPRQANFSNYNRSSPLFYHTLSKFCVFLSVGPYNIIIISSSSWTNIFASVEVIWRAHYTMKYTLKHSGLSLTKYKK